MSTKTMVFNALDNAKANGYTPLEAPDELIAQELITFDASLEDYSPSALIPFIQEWKTKHDESQEES